MAQFITVVYHEENEANPGVFHVVNIDKKKLQEAFDEHDIFSIKCITIETDSSLGEPEFKTIFTNSDIKNFLDSWEIDFL